MPTLLYRDSVRQLAGIAILFVVYFATARVGLSIHPVNHFATLIWPPSGIALVALVLYGYELWPGVAIAAFFINLTLGAPPPVAIAIAAGNTLQPLVGAYFLKKYVGFNPLFSRLQDSFGFIVTSFFSTFIAASIGTLSLYVGGLLTSDALSSTWFAWWIGDSLGILVVGAFLARWLCRPFFIKTLSEIVEGLIVFPALIAINLLIFWTPISEIANIPLIYLLFIPYIWAALRTGPRGITLSTFLTATIAVTSVLFGRENFVLVGGANELLLLQIFVGTIAVIFLIFTSIVEERKEAIVSLEDHVHKLEDALEQIRDSDDAKNVFIATLAHELRNPLSPIVSSLELLQTKGVEHQESPHLLRVIDNHVRTISRLLDDLLDISRITRKKFTLQKETVELQSVIYHSIETVDSILKSKKHTLAVNMPQEPLWLLADPVRLEQIFVNLLFNAAKYTEPGGHVSLTVTLKKNIVQICIKDTGMGIPQEMLAQIFEPFVQGDISRGRIGTGLGIGLSLTKRLAELHGGEVWARSEGKDKGSEFYVQLPMVPALQPAPVLPQLALQPSTNALLSASEQVKVLVVDDNEPAAVGLGNLLRHKGYDVELAYDGPHAMSIAKKFRPGIVLLDIGLPGMDGYEVAKKLRQEELDSGLIIIALTGYGQSDDKERAKKAGFNHHLTKPVSINDVEKAIARLKSPRPVVV